MRHRDLVFVCFALAALALIVLVPALVGGQSQPIRFAPVVEEPATHAIAFEPIETDAADFSIERIPDVGDLAGDTGPIDFRLDCRAGVCRLVPIGAPHRPHHAMASATGRVRGLLTRSVGLARRAIPERRGRLAGAAKRLTTWRPLRRHRS